MKDIKTTLLLLIIFSILFITLVSGQALKLNIDESYTYHINKSYENATLHRGGIEILGNVTLSWNNLRSANCYNIYAIGKIIGGNFGKEDFGTENNIAYTTCNLGGEASRATKHSLDGLTPNTNWYFMISAVTADGSVITFSEVQNVTFDDWCTDSDGGRNYEKSGNTRDSFEERYYNDVCMDDYKSVVEYYCGYDGSLEHYKVLSEEYECPSGYYCSNGACVSLEHQKCIDTDGWNSARKGLRIAYDDNLDDVSVKVDFCIVADTVSKYPELEISDDPKKRVQTCEGKKCYVIEYQCRDENISDEYTVYWCVQGCNDGACVAYTLEDSIWKKVINWLRDLFGL